ncbi:hypothetical protein IPF37_06340 [bacterium]|nr:MAG: hypothetical protein IPF37_06340 [bacterium]
MIKKRVGSVIFLFFFLFSGHVRTATGGLESDLTRIIATQRIKLQIRLSRADELIYYDSLLCSLDYEGVIIKGFKTAHEPVVRHVVALRADKKVVQAPLRLTLRLAFNSAAQLFGSDFYKTTLYVSFVSLDPRGRHTCHYLRLPLAGGQVISQAPARSGVRVCDVAASSGLASATKRGQLLLPDQTSFVLDPVARMLVRLRYAVTDLVNENWCWLLYLLILLVVVATSLGMMATTTTQRSFEWLCQVRLFGFVGCLLLTTRFMPRTLFFPLEALLFLILGLFLVRPVPALPVGWVIMRFSAGAALLVGVFPLLVKALLVFCGY